MRRVFALGGLALALASGADARSAAAANPRADLLLAWSCSIAEDPTTAKIVFSFEVSIKNKGNAGGRGTLRVAGILKREEVAHRARQFLVAAGKTRRISATLSAPAAPGPSALGTATCRARMHDVRAVTA